MSHHQPVQAPKVISGPQIMGKGIELSQVQTFMQNLKLLNAATSASNGGTSSLKVGRQST